MSLILIKYNINNHNIIKNNHINFENFGRESKTYAKSKLY